jgi:GTP cyclohydrolase II
VHISDPQKQLAVRVDDEGNGSDEFSSDICTCRPDLVQGIEICVQTAQSGGSGVIVYLRKQGRALGEVTKFLVYNARKRLEGGDRADAYFTRTLMCCRISRYAVSRTKTRRAALVGYPSH